MNVTLADRDDRLPRAPRGGRRAGRPGSARTTSIGRSRPRASDRPRRSSSGSVTPRSGGSCRARPCGASRRSSPLAQEARARESSRPTCCRRARRPEKAYDLLLRVAAKKGDSVLCAHGDLDSRTGRGGRPRRGENRATVVGEGLDVAARMGRPPLHVGPVPPTAVATAPAAPRRRVFGSGFRVRVPARRRPARARRSSPTNASHRLRRCSSSSAATPDIASHASDAATRRRRRRRTVAEHRQTDQPGDARYPFADHLTQRHASEAGELAVVGTHDPGVKDRLGRRASVVPRHDPPRQPADEQGADEQDTVEDESADPPRDRREWRVDPRRRRRRVPFRRRWWRRRRGTAARRRGERRRRRHHHPRPGLSLAHGRTVPPGARSELRGDSGAIAPEWNQHPLCSTMRATEPPGGGASTCGLRDRGTQTAVRSMRTWASTRARSTAKGVTASSWVGPPSRVRPVPEMVGGPERPRTPAPRATAAAVSRSARAPREAADDLGRFAAVVEVDGRAAERVDAEVLLDPLLHRRRLLALRADG